MSRPPVPDLPPDRIAEARAFIRANLPLAEVPGTGLRLHLAAPRSGLSRLVPPGGTPYWAHAWPGGHALALHLAAHPELVRGRLAWDLGTGSGLVALAALRAGAESVVAFDADPLALVAVRLNAEANGIAPPLTSLAPDPTKQMAGDPIVLAGDVFYSEEAARRSTAVLDSTRASLGPATTVLVGDIGRRFLPRERLEPLACYPVRDVGDPPSTPPRDGWVFRWTP